VIPTITHLEVFLIDGIITNQDIKITKTTCFGLTLAIIRFHLEKLFCKIVIQLCKRALVLSSHHLCSLIRYRLTYSTAINEVLSIVFLLICSHIRHRKVFHNYC